MSASRKSSRGQVKAKLGKDTPGSRGSGGHEEIICTFPPAIGRPVGPPEVILCTFAPQDFPPVAIERPVTPPNRELTPTSPPRAPRATRHARRGRGRGLRGSPSGVFPPRRRQDLTPAVSPTISELDVLLHESLDTEATSQSGASEDDSDGIRTSPTRPSRVTAPRTVKPKKGRGKQAKAAASRKAAKPTRAKGTHAMTTRSRSRPVYI